MQNHVIPMFWFGVDIGNRTTIGARRDPDSQLEVITRFPSFVVDVNLEDHLRRTRGIGSSSDEEDDGLLTYDGKYYYFGDRARLQGELADDARGAGGRYWSLHNFILLLGIIAQSLREPGHLLSNLAAYNPDEDAYEFEVKLATGMPVSVYSTQRADFVREAYTGIHRFSYSGKKYIVHLSVGPVVMEGVSGLLLYGNAASPKKMVCFDGGFWSSEIVTMQGGHVINDNSDGFPIGIGLSFDFMRESVANDFDKELDEEEIQSLLLARARREALPPISLYDHLLPVDRLETIADNALAKYGIPFQQRIVSKLSSARGLIATDIGVALMIGGAAYYALRFIQAKIPHTKTVNEPEKVNARSYCLIAMRYKWDRVKSPALVESTVR